MGQDGSGQPNKLIIIGSIGAPFGVHGWLKVNSYTYPKESILKFNNWLLVDHVDQDSINRLLVKIIERKQISNKFLVLFANVTDRNQAIFYINKKIAITKSNLPKLVNNQYYWEELVGCKVYNLNNQYFGIVDYLFATKANDILVIKNSINNKEYLVPYSLGNFIVNINIIEKIIIIDWELD